MDVTWRPKQRETIDKCVQLVRIGIKNVLIDAPTGFGKSLVNYHIAKELHEKYGYRAYYLTPQVALLDQIERDKNLDIAVIKGRENYPCFYGKNCAVGLCRKLRTFKCDKVCPYRRAKERAMNHWITAASFAYYIMERMFAGELKDREVIIVDEADDLENWADDFGSFTFKVDQNFTDLDSVVVWAKAVKKVVAREMLEIDLMEEKSEKTLERYEQLSKYHMKLSIFLESVDRDRNNWVFECDGKKLVVKPVDVGSILRRLVWDTSKIRICSSATILDRYMFCKTVGLNPDETAIIKVKSFFPKENRPAFYIPVAKMTKEERENSYSAVAEAVAEIVRIFRGHRGICHAHSYEIAKAIYNRVSVDGVRVAVHDREDRNEVFERFLNGEIDFLICVGFIRGVDLKDDLARYQIIVKVPYPDESDPRVRELWVNRKAWNWARYHAIRNIVQAYGRIVRSETDWGATIILDKSMEYLIRYKKQFPEWFLEAFEVADFNRVREWLVGRVKG